MKRRSVLFSMLLIGVVFCIFALPGYGQAAGDLPRTVSIATHPKGSLMNLIGGGFAKIITGHLSTQASDRPFTGYTTWLPLLNAGEVDMGIVTSPESYVAYMGEGPYKKALKNIRVLSSGSGVALSYIVRADSGIKKMSELKGKRVSIDKASFVTNTENKTVLRAAGLDPEKDITPVMVAGVAELVYSVMDGRTDAGWAAVGSGQTKEVAGRVGGVYWLSVCGSKDDAGAKLIKEKVAGARIVQIKAGKIRDVENDALVMETPIYLASSKEFSEDAAYAITKAIWENQKELAQIHPIFKAWKHERMAVEDVTIPYHPGAIKFYKEVGAWTPAMDEVQAKLLAK